MLASLARGLVDCAEPRSGLAVASIDGPEEEEPMQLEGRSVVLTGAGSGIGRHSCP